MPDSLARSDDAASARISGLVRAAGRPADVVAFEESVVSFFVQAADLLGVPKSVAAIYGVCFASSEPLGFSEIQERLDISSGSISQGLRVLRETGALKATGERGSIGAVGASEGRLPRGADASVRASRTTRYEPDLELRKLVSHWLEERLEKQIDSGSGRLQAVLANVPSTDASSAERLRDRLHALQTWHMQARAVLPLVKTFLKLG